MTARLAAVLARGRARAEQRMQSRVTVHRKGPTKPDPVTGFHRPTWTTPHVGLPFRLDSPGTNDGGSRAVDIGGVEVEGATAMGHVPWDTVDLQDDDLFEITDGECAGDVYRLVKATRTQQKTARRLPLVDAKNGREWEVSP